MPWLQLQLRSDPETAPRLEALLEASGAASVTMVDAADQPLFEPGPGETPLWQNILITGLFEAGTDAEAVIETLRTAFQPDTLPAIEQSLLEDQNWHRAWMEDFKPMRFGKRLWICPSWCEAPAADAVNLMLDPGLAFGTGTHPTTALCLEWLDGADIKGQTLIDYGCGSGILGIAALLLGAKHIHGVDNDPQALIASRDNCLKNNIGEDRFHTWLPEDFDDAVKQDALEQCEGILANILAEPLMALAPKLAGLVKEGGWIVLSGILEEQADYVIKAYQPWFCMEPARIKDGWVRLAGKRLNA